MPTLQKYLKHMFMLLYMLVSEDFCVMKLIRPSMNFFMTMWKVQVLEVHVHVVGHVGFGGLLIDGVVPPVLETVLDKMSSDTNMSNNMNVYFEYLCSVGTTKLKYFRR